MTDVRQPDRAFAGSFRRRRPSAVALVLAGAVLWGTTGTAQALGPAAADPQAVGAARLVLGGGLLAVWAWCHHRWAGESLAGWTAPHRVILGAGLAGAVAMAVYQVTFFAAVDGAGVSVGTAVTIGSAPVFTGGVEWLFRRVVPTARWWVATALAGSGVIVLLGPTAVDPSAVGLALAAGFSYAVFAVASKSLLDRGVTARTAMGGVFGVAALLLVPVLAVTDLGWLAGPAGAVMVVWLGVAATMVAYLAFAAGLRGVPASTAATVSLAEPLTAAILGAILLGERMGAGGSVGAGLIASGLLVLVIRRGGRAPA